MLATDADTNTRRRRDARGARDHPGSGARGDPAPAGGRVDRVVLRYHSRPLACELAPVGAGDHEELELELAEPAYGVAPGQTACLLDGDLVVGRATIAA